MDASEGPNIILIHADALRADRLGIYGNNRDTSPFIDGLISKSGFKFDHGFSNCSESLCGFSSVLTSSFSYAKAEVSMLDLLGNKGYIINVIGAGDLGHGGLDGFFRPRADNFLRADLAEGYYQHDDQYIIDALDSYPDYRKIPNFFYLRMMSSHGLGSHREEFKKYKPTSKSLLSVFNFGSDDQMRINDHDNFAVQLDAYVNQIFTTLGDKGYLDNAVVVIFGDHGDAIGEHGTYGHYNSLYQEEIHVPILFWSSPNIDLGLKSDQFASLMDIPVTILRHLGMEVPATFSGYPLQESYGEKIAYLNDRRGSRGLIYQKGSSLLKLIESDSAERMLFDLIEDPDERMNLYQADNDPRQYLFETPHLASAR
jgi:arylsulfatase A-like enzyme